MLHWRVLSWVTPLVLSVGPAAGAEDPAQSYRVLFGAEEARVSKTRSTKDDAEFAAKLLRAVGEVSDAPKLQVLLCEKAYAFGLKHRAGHTTAIEAMESLAKITTGREVEIRNKALAAHELRYRHARGAERALAGEGLLGVLVAMAAEEIHAGKPSEAVVTYRRALSLATSLRSLRRKDVLAAYQDALACQKARKQMARLARSVADNPKNRLVAGKLLMLYLVEADDPNKASGLLDAAEADERLRTYVPLAAGSIDNMVAATCSELGHWYRSLAKDATRSGKRRMLERARACFGRYLQLHETPDAAQEKVQDALARVEAELDALFTWVELLRSVDLKKHFNEGDWTRQKGSLVGGPARHSRVMLPASARGSYELVVRFTRKRGDGEVNVVFPAGKHQCILILEGWSDTRSGLRSINGKEPGDNETTVKGKILVNGKEQVLILRVEILPKANARVSTKLNGKLLFSWEGPEKSLTVGCRPWGIPRDDCFSLGTENATVLFHSAKLRALR